jgi:transcriptional regulator with XRE-family HTH domain
MTIGLQVFKARDDAGLTQKQLAEMVGINKNSVSDIENERQAVSVKMLRRIAAALETEFVIRP